MEGRWGIILVDSGSHFGHALVHTSCLQGVTHRERKLLGLYATPGSPVEILEAILWKADIILPSHYQNFDSCSSQVDAKYLFEGIMIRVET